ncbi:riboflavin synthase [Candidatus Nanohalobium constans]|uniref:Riboflavin synthase n=1 Tax=Candidatus Nanohalobium constans TaxID=2565781 RepID=A0A5Q0UH81_9ARCH|nr:riboflavin synthase [Candidatus Nanohalobium constans]QGA80315.1 riboflavin synthase alpha chain [Candidatus Nanohalobium constans]
MFTGLVEETGKIREVRETGEGKRITVEAEEVVEDVSKGDSISVSGACLTVEEFSDSTLDFFLAEETLDKTWFSDISEEDEVNLERSLKAGDRMGGHQVQGHVEAVAEVLEVEELEEGWNMSFGLPESMSNYVVEKGFITVEGISLTTTEVTEDSFCVTIIPETWEVTNLSEKEEGDEVNLESDPIGRYVEKMVG